MVGKQDARMGGADPKVFIVRDRYAKVNAVHAIEKIGAHGAVILRARGLLISDAVNVANILTYNMLRGTSSVERVTVDSIDDEYTGRLVSTIEIVVKKNK